MDQQQEPPVQRRGASPNESGSPESRTTWVQRGRRWVWRGERHVTLEDAEELDRLRSEELRHD